MTKKNIIICLLAICLAHITFVNEVFAFSSDGVSCGTSEVDNEFAELDKTLPQVKCGTCTWRTIKVGWEPGDSGGKYEYHTEAAYASVQTCKSHASYSCTSVLMTGSVDCPDDEDDGGSEG